jgi:hypothetical protein
MRASVLVLAKLNHSIACPFVWEEQHAELYYGLVRARASRPSLASHRSHRRRDLVVEMNAVSTIFHNSYESNSSSIDGSPQSYFLISNYLRLPTSIEDRKGSQGANLRRGSMTRKMILNSGLTEPSGFSGISVTSKLRGTGRPVEVQKGRSREDA